MACTCDGAAIPCFSPDSQSVVVGNCLSAGFASPLALVLQSPLTPASTFAQDITFQALQDSQVLERGTRSVSSSTPSALDWLDLASSSLSAGSSTTLTLRFAYANGIFDQARLSVSLPGFVPSAGCTPSNAACTVSGSTLTAVYTVTSAPKQTFLTFSATNPSTTSPQPITVTLQSSTATFRLSTVTYTPASQALSLVLQYSAKALGASGTVQMNVACAIFSATTTVVFPGGFQLGACTGTGCSVAGQKVTFSGSSASIAAVNPSLPSSQLFSAHSQDSAGSVACRLTQQIRFTLSCDLPCAECSSSSVCTSCYGSSFSRLAEGRIYLSSGQCVAACPAATFLNSGVCTACPSGCTGCTSSSACTGCQASLLLASGSCVSVCPNTQYPVSGVCQPCPGCLTCSSSGACLTCGAGLFLSGQACVSNCPLGSYGSSGSCQPCPLNCLSCSGSGCLLCYQPYLMPSCTSSCSAGLYQSRASSCVACPCPSCVTYSHQCRSCTSPQVLQDGVCGAVCLPGYFSSSGVCQQCSAFCTTCLASGCSACVEGRSLYQG